MTIFMSHTQLLKRGRFCSTVFFLFIFKLDSRQALIKELLPQFMHAVRESI